MPVKLDVTQGGDVQAAAASCADVNLLINNAGIMLVSPMLAEDSEFALRAEMEVNVFGMLHMVRAFAPMLAKNGGGAIANMLSVVSQALFHDVPAFEDQIEGVEIDWGGRGAMVLEASESERDYLPIDRYLIRQCRLRLGTIRGSTMLSNHVYCYRRPCSPKHNHWLVSASSLVRREHAGKASRYLHARRSFPREISGRDGCVD